MNNPVSTYEPIIRTVFFIGVFLTVVRWEQCKPRRALTASKKIRWLNNLGIVFLNTILLRLLFPIMAVEVAVYAQEGHWGLLNNMNIPLWSKVFAAVIFLDMVIYLQHVMVHYVPLLWRIHRMHHTDTDYDVTTGARFHPIEIFISMGIKMFVVAALGAPAAAVMIFEILLNATAMFNHGNIYITENRDRILRLFVVTPDMHRVHHSVKFSETNSNFGFNFPWWDRIFGTYILQPEEGHLDMTIGLDQFREEKYLKIHWLLIQPFLKNSHGQMIRIK